MHPFHLALSLARIPRLFSALFLVPCLLSILLIYAQLQLTSFLIQEVDQDTVSLKERAKKRRKKSLIRKLLLKSDEPLGPIEVCRWSSTSEPPCELSFYDVVLRVEAPETADIVSYLELFQGNFRKVHVCKE